jgi:hypothetical protein
MFSEIRFVNPPCAHPLNQSRALRGGLTKGLLAVVAMFTIGIDWRRLTKDRAVANFCTPAPFVLHILLSILALWPKSRRTPW